MMWARRLLIGSGMALASAVMVPSIAGAAAPGCYVGCAPPNVVATNTSPPPPAAVHNATVSPSSGEPRSDGASSSLPFTGADVEGLAIVGAGAVLAGGLLLRRRRHTLA